MEQLIADPVSADHKTNESRVWQRLLGAVIDNQSHLLAGAPETKRNGHGESVWRRH